MFVVGSCVCWLMQGSSMVAPGRVANDIHQVGGGFLGLSVPWNGMMGETQGSE